MQTRWAGRIPAVLSPTTRPRESTSGPPEFPGLRAASVWITSSISRPPTERNERPSALTTPAVTVLWKPSGLPIATTSWPTRSAPESPSSATVSETGGTRSTARSVSGSSPTSSARTRRPSGNAASSRVASWTTWLVVSTNPSGVNTNPEPFPGTSRAGRPRRSTLWRTSTLTTAGPTCSAAPGTACEYASSSSPAVGPAAALGAGADIGSSETGYSVAVMTDPPYMLAERRLVPAPGGAGRRIFAPDMDVTGSLAVVTGATAGIGRATAFALGRAGARVAICARTEANVHATVRDLTAAGVGALRVGCDRSGPAHVDGVPAVGGERG